MSTACADSGVVLTIEPVELRFHDCTVPGQLDLAINCWGGLERDEDVDENETSITPEDDINLLIISPSVPTEPVIVGKVEYPAYKTFLFRLSVLQGATLGDNKLTFKLAGTSGTVLYYETVINLREFMNV